MTSTRTIAAVIACLMLLLCVLAPATDINSRPDADISVKSLNASAPAGASDFDYDYFDGEGIYIWGYNGNAESVIIPETIGGYPVYAVAGFAFEKKSNLKYVRIPASAVMVDSSAFNLCSSLETIDVAPGSTDYKSVGGVLYSYDGTSLVAFPAARGGSFTVPKGVEYIESYAFDHCYNLTDVNMYNTVTYIGAYAFSFCWSLESIRLSDRLHTLGKMALAGCEELSEVHLPASLDTIGTDALLGLVGSEYGDKQYYFTDGLYAVPGTKSAEYAVKLGVEVTGEYHSITDIDTGIVLYDIENKIPGTVDISVKPVAFDKVADIFNRKYTKAGAYDISLVNNGKPYALKSEVSIVFNAVDPTMIPSASAVYLCEGGRAAAFEKAPQDSRIYALTDTLGRFAVLSSDDFSLKGDADGDGRVTTFDARIALCASIGILEPTAAQKSACTFTGSNKITLDDVRQILCMAAGII